MSLGARVHQDGVLVRTHLHRAGRQDDVLVADRGRHVARREPPRVETRRVDVDHDLPLFAAVGPGEHRAGDGDHVGADEVGAEVEELLLAERVTLERGLHDGDVGRAVADDERRRGARRHLPQHRLRDRRHLRRRRLDARPRLEEDLDDRQAGERLALDVLDVVDRRGEAALVVGDDALLHLLGGEAGVVPHHRDRPGCRCPGRCRSASARMVATPRMAMRMAMTTKV